MTATTSGAGKAVDVMVGGVDPRVDAQIGTIDPMPAHGKIFRVIAYGAPLVVDCTCDCLGNAVGIHRPEQIRISIALRILDCSVEPRAKIIGAGKLIDHWMRVEDGGQLAAATQASCLEQRWRNRKLPVIGGPVAERRLPLQRRRSRPTFPWQVGCIRRAKPASGVETIAIGIVNQKCPNEIRVGLAQTVHRVGSKRRHQGGSEARPSDYRAAQRPHMRKMRCIGLEHTARTRSREAHRAHPARLSVRFVHSTANC